MKTIRLHVPDLPADLHKKMKIAAAKSEKSIKAWVMEAIQEKLERENGS